MKQFISKKEFAAVVLRNWPLRMIVFLFLKPKRFFSNFIYPLIDYSRFKKSISSYRAYLAKLDNSKSSLEKEGLLIVAGVMNILWCQLWTVLAGIFEKKGFDIFVLTSKSEPVQNLYFGLFRIKKIYIEDLKIENIVLNDTLVATIDQLDDFDNIKCFEHDGVPVGKMALSTYSRMQATGIMDVSDLESLAQVREWMLYICKSMKTAIDLYEANNISMLFFTELFMDYYGGFYYGALSNKKNIIRFAGTVRDNAIVVTHQTLKNDRTHFSSISEKLWASISSEPINLNIEEELHQNFMDRYGDRWMLSKRNQPDTRIVSAEIAKQELGISSARKVAIIYSHILYDTLFFNGEYLFGNYAEWLVESIKAACKNPHVDWYVKIHPSNLWRGELEYYHDGIYEEVRLIEEHIGQLPDHVKLIYPDTPYSPYTWLKIADYGITVTGTSGIELGALGKVVVTAGTGRYEDIGFTINSASPEEYIKTLERIQEVPLLSPKQIDLGKKFAYVTFCMKPYTMDYFKPVPRAGKLEIFNSDDLVYLGNFSVKMLEIPHSLGRFVEWSLDRKDVDFLNEWPGVENESVNDIDSLNKQMVAAGGN